MFSLVITPDMARACSVFAQVEITTNEMRPKCASALANKKRFLAKVKSGALDAYAVRDYVLAFDDGKTGCKKNVKFVFRILDSFYSVPERKFEVPWLLQRYAFAWPETHDPARRKYAYDLLWLFNENTSYLPQGWTTADARAFVERPEHWKIAFAKFGNSRERDDAVFASVTDPKSVHFDREVAVRLAAFSSKHQLQRQMTAASLFVDPQAGPTDYAKAEMLLPIVALYSDATSDPVLQNARAIWTKIADGYAQSSNPAEQERGRQLQDKMAPPSLAKWPTIEHPKDGRVWLSLGNWPKSVANPFDTERLANLITADDYPVRALRDEETGPVTIAARFAANGRFSSLEVIQSSGSDLLDAATLNTIQRRYQRKVSEMTIAGYKGHEIMVPLLVVDWQISEAAGEERGITNFKDGRLTVISYRYKYEPYSSNCGTFSSIFI